MTPEFTTVIGVDEKHLEQLALVWPTWRRYKPEVLDGPMVVFHDWRQVEHEQVRAVVDHPDLKIVAWPPEEGIEFGGCGTGKWDDPQRSKMLSGFIHVAARHVATPYWLKLDTDVVATGPDRWIDLGWFAGGPAIVSHRWGFTKPPDQMLRLDRWVEENRGAFKHMSSSWYKELLDSPPLNLSPEPGRDLWCHRRIISWCAFFRTDFTRFCRDACNLTCGDCKMPVPSQDGLLWYLAKRLGLPITRTNMKNHNWSHWLTMKNIRREVEKALNYGV